MRSNRRAFLAAGGALVGSGLAGCLGSGDGAGPEATTQSVQTTGEATTTGPYDRTYSATELDTVVSGLEADEVSLSLVPADEDADYADSVIFSEYTGELRLELDLDRALDQRQYHNPVTTWSHVQDFHENAHKNKWRREKHEGYIKEFDGENVLELKEEVDWDLYQNGGTLDERLEQSGVHDLWYKHAMTHPEIDGISSSHNGIKAAAYQALEHRHGHDTFIWQHFSEGSSAGHGLIAATENPTRDPEQTAQQQNYTIETNYQVEQQIANVEESNFFNGDNAGSNGNVEHPAEHDHSKDETGMYMYTGAWNADGAIWDKVRNGFPDSLAHEFTDEWFRNPESQPAFDYFDRTNTVAYLAEENDGYVDHTKDELRFRSPT